MIIFFFNKNKVVLQIHYNNTATSINIRISITYKLTKGPNTSAIINLGKILFLVSMV